MKTDADAWRELEQVLDRQQMNIADKLHEGGSQWYETHLLGLPELTFQVSVVPGESDENDSPNRGEPPRFRIKVKGQSRHWDASDSEGFGQLLVWIDCAAGRGKFST